MNGKVRSNVGQRVALWPVFPHEKHFTSDQLRRTCRSLGPCRGDCSVKYVRSNVSSPGGSAGVGGGSSLFTASDNNSWTNLSLGDSSGALAGGGTFGVSTANNFTLINRAVRFIYCNHTHRFSFIIWLLHHISRINRVWQRFIDSSHFRICMTLPHSS